MRRPPARESTWYRHGVGVERKGKGPLKLLQRVGGLAVVGDDVDERAVELEHGQCRPSHTREARCAIVSKTGWVSVGEAEIARRISLVAVCCSSDSVSSRFRASSSWEQAHVLDRDHRLVREGLEKLDLLVGEGPHACPDES